MACLLLAPAGAFIVRWELLQLGAAAVKVSVCRFCNLSHRCCLPISPITVLLLICFDVCHMFCNLLIMLQLGTPG
jgi:hypothetical protein